MKAMIILATLAPVAAHADNFAAIAEGQNVTTVTTGVEHGLVVGAGYEHVASIAGRPIVIGGDFSVSAAGMDPSDSRVRIGALVPIVRGGAWQWIGGFAAVTTSTDNDVARMIDVGADFAMLGGYYAPRWFAAAELRFDWAIATHIAQSDAYKMQYSGARDGWYGNAGGLIRGGLQTGVSFGGNDLTLCGGMMRDDAGNPPMLPFYATLAYDRRW